MVGRGKISTRGVVYTAVRRLSRPMRVPCHPNIIPGRAGGKNINRSCNMRDISIRFMNLFSLS